MSKKSELVAKLLKEVDLRHPYPKAPQEGLDLVSQGAVLILMRHLTEKQAVQSVQALCANYEDWNEVRVSQVQEIASHFKTSSRKKGPELLRELSPAADALKAYLQDVFQQTHGLSLEFLREDVAAGGKTIAEINTLGLTGGGFLLWVASDGEVPVHLGLARILDRLGLIPRTSSVKKATATIAPLVGPGKALEFTLVFHEIAERWNDPDEPIFMTVDALRATPNGKKAYKDRLTQLERDRVRLEREEERRVKNEAREAERLRREEEKERKRAEAAARKKTLEMERRRKVAEREKAKKRKEAERVKAAAKKKAEAKRAAEAKKKAAKKKAARKKTTKKKSGAKKTTRKKAAKKAVKRPAAKKKTTKKAAKKQTAKKRAARKKTTVKRGGARKPAATSAKKKAKKKAKKAPARRKSPRRR